MGYRIRDRQGWSLTHRFRGQGLESPRLVLSEGNNYDSKNSKREKKSLPPPTVTKKRIKTHIYTPTQR